MNKIFNCVVVVIFVILVLAVINGVGLETNHSVATIVQKYDGEKRRGKTGRETYHKIVIVLKNNKYLVQIEKALYDQLKEGDEVVVGYSYGRLGGLSVKQVRMLSESDN